MKPVWKHSVVLYRFHYVEIFMTYENITCYLQVFQFPVDSEYANF
jgi:hypothetical protein